MTTAQDVLPQIKATTAAADEVEEGQALVDGLRGLLAEDADSEEVLPDG